jgi:hypothetical protein
VGRADLVESRLVGMKSRGVYETPAGTVLHEALEDLCRLVLPHDLLRTRAELAPRMADLIYAGQWFSPLRRALQAFVDNALQVATGEVTVELFHGQARAVARTSPQSLYRPALASFDMTGYDARTPRASSVCSGCRSRRARARDGARRRTARTAEAREPERRPEVRMPAERPSDGVAGASRRRSIRARGAQRLAAGRSAAVAEELALSRAYARRSSSAAS